MTTPVTLAGALLADSFGRVADDLPELLTGLSREALLWRPDAAANSIGWLAWHLTRVQDDHLAGIAGIDQVWTDQGFARRFALPYDDADIGYGHTSDQVAAFEVTDAELLGDYHAAVHTLTLRVIDQLSETDYDRVVDPRWDPPVTAAVRLISVTDEIARHTGQIGYLRGLWERR